MFSGLLTKYHGLKPLLVGVPYPVVYEIPAKRNQYPPQPKHPNYNPLPDQPNFDHDTRNMYALSEVEKKMVDKFRQQRGQSFSIRKGFSSNSTPEHRLYSRNQGGQGGQGGHGGQGGQGWQGEQLGPSGYSSAPTRDTVDISEYEESPVEWALGG